VNQCAEEEREGLMKRVERRCCPVCLEEVPALFVESWREFSIWCCRECGLQFADPLVYSPEMYSEGYGDPSSQLAQDTGFFEHVPYGAALARLEDVTAFLTPLERKAWRWICSRMEKDAPVLDLGCGCGRFLMALRQSGYAAYGLDVAKPPVEMLQRCGFAVAQGTIENYPSRWPMPRVVSCFEVLEHVPAPVDFLKAIRERFPEAWLVLSVPLPVEERCTRVPGFKREADYPPNHLTRWTRKSLAKAFQKSGYEAQILKVHITGDELNFRPHLGIGLGRLLRRMLRPQRARVAQAENRVAGLRLQETQGQNGLAQQAFWRDFYRSALAPYVLSLRLFGNSGYAYLVLARGGEQEMARAA
jgi:SAM-dependent methyltransferase